MKNNTTGGFMSAHGKLPVSMTNDYLFHALMQENNKALIALICAILRLDPNTIQSATITNPIIIGQHLDANKEVILDVNVHFNNAAFINIEMQVISYENWVNRTLYYLCRNFSHLHKGDDYALTKPCIQIDLLDYTLFPKAPEFLAEYRLLNVRNHQEYSDKLQLYVLDLTKIDMATTEDKLYNIDKWAQLFKSTTWEEVQMLAKNDQAISNAASTIFELTADDIVRAQIQAREDYLRDQRSIEASRRRVQEEIQRTEQELQQTEQELQQTEQELQQTKNELSENKAENHRLRELLAANNIPIE